MVVGRGRPQHIDLVPSRPAGRGHQHRTALTAARLIAGPHPAIGATGSTHRDLVRRGRQDDQDVADLELSVRTVLVGLDERSR
jgi:hypothetical protein